MVRRLRPGIGGHGTLTASNVVGQGRAKGLAPTFTDLDPADWPGVVGGAPDAKLLPFGDIYFGFDTSTQLAYILTNLAGVDATSNSYGTRTSTMTASTPPARKQTSSTTCSATGRRCSDRAATARRATARTTRRAPPRASRSAPRRCTARPAGTRSSRPRQIVGNEWWCGRTAAPGDRRQPASTSSPTAHAARATARSTRSCDGNNAWETWGGTSRSTPVAAAPRPWSTRPIAPTHGGTAPNADTAKSILLSSAKDLGYDSWTQGAGSLDAGAAVDLTLGHGRRACRRTTGARATTTARSGTSSRTCSRRARATRRRSGSGRRAHQGRDRQLGADAARDVLVHEQAAREREPYNFNAPDYVIDITERVKRHKKADLMVVRVNFPYSQFDANGDYVDRSGMAPADVQLEGSGRRRPDLQRQ